MPFQPHTDEELLKLLSTTHSLDDKQVKTNDFLLFLSNFNLDNGEQTVDIDIIYNLYANWSKQPIKRREFDKLVHGYFKHVPNYRSLILLNTSSLNLSKEALKYLKEENNTLEKSFIYHKKHFEAFLKYYNLTSGKTPVSINKLYSLYNNWTHYNNKKRYNKERFTNLCNIMIPYTNTKKGIFYMISSNISDILEQERKLLLHVSGEEDAKKEE